jgi:putative membrane protein
MNMENNRNKEMKSGDMETRRLNPLTDWLIMLIKGIIVGIGFILPGLSGGVLAVIVGMYDPLIRFLANLKERFLKNLLFFLPFAIGAAIGIVLFAVVVEKAFGKYAAQFVCLFVGFVAGTFPSLYRTAGKEGRKSRDFIVLILSAVGIFALMLAGGKQLTEVDPNILSWLASGLLMGLGLIVPGLSPSNFLIYFGMYDKMATGIKDFDFAVIIPLIVGFALCVILFSKLAAHLFKKYYSGMYHFILGLVIGSSLAIFPTVVMPAFQPDQLSVAGLSTAGALLFCLVLFVAGTIASYLFSKLEEKYPREEIF